MSKRSANTIFELARDCEDSGPEPIRHQSPRVPDDILVQIRMAADDQPRNTGFLAGRANAKIVQTRLGVCSGGRDLRQGQQTPLPVAKFHQVSRGRSGLQCQRTCDRGKQVALSSCLLASDKFLSTDMTCHEHYHRQKDTYAHTPPCRAQTENESGLSG